MSWRERISAVTLAVLTGCIFVWFNFNGLFRHFAKESLSSDSPFSTSVMSISLFPKQILGSSPEALYFWMAACFAGIWVYLGAILLLAIVHRRVILAGSGLLGIVGGVLTPALLCWTSWLVWGVLQVVGIIFRFIAYVLGVVITFIVKALVFAFPVLIGIALVAAIIWVWKTRGPKLLIFGAVGALALYFLAPVIEVVLEKLRLLMIWISEMLAFLFGWLPAVLRWLLMAAVALLGITFIIGVVGSAGQILIDQLKTAIEAGKSQKAVLTASLSLGVSMALILLVASGSPQAAIAQEHPTVSAEAEHQTMARGSRTTMLAKKRKRRKSQKAPKIAPAVVGAAVVAAPPTLEPMADIATAIDRAWKRSTWVFENESPTHIFLATLPGGVEEWARKAFRTATAPIFDAMVLALVIGLSLIGLLRGIFSHSELEYKMRFYNRDLLMLAVVPLVAVAFMVIASSQENQE